MSVSFGVTYDFRNPGRWRRPWDRLYRELLDQIQWLDERSSFSEVALSEHHFLDDGFLPSVMAAGAAVIERTRRVGVSTQALLMPLHHPLRVAEDALFLDALSGGRFRLGLGNGYRGEEFEGFGTSMKHRGARMEESLSIIRAAFSGERFSHYGAHYQFADLAVSPVVVRQGGPPVWLGGAAERAIRRAAQHADGFLATSDEQIASYFRACDELRTPPERRKVCRVVLALIDEDPERAMAEVGDYVVYQINQYIEYGLLAMAPFDDVTKIHEIGLFPFVDAGGAKELIRPIVDRGVEEVQLLAVLAGEPVEAATRRLEYISRTVVPAFA
jgi:alkanesulfonate monooxygenase SsuD/methylene tetrahydromethanopterin reductase-like flavin-dependent oxidoreductase (luciferase family)